MTKIKLADAYLRRKELLSKIALMRSTKHDALESMDEYNHYTRGLRLIESAIQQACWSCELTVAEDAVNDYKKLDACNK